MAKQARLARHMSGGSSATPLIGLDAVVIDTETTGLDAARARIVELAAVRIRTGRVGEDAFRSLVNPDEPIPSAASRIHGIDDAAVKDAPRFREAWPGFSGAIDGAVVIGHTLGFDLAVLKRECERAGIPWRRPRTLDTRLLAEVTDPDLAGYSLDQVAAWLGIEVAGRHSALADASLTARVFLGLLPKLREGGIRTLAEAEQACRALTDALDQQHRAGWIEPVQAPSRRDAERALARIDSYPYRHRVRDVMKGPPRFVAPDVAVGDALKQMAAARISSLFVATAGASPPRPQDAGIVTERDVMRALAESDAQALAVPVSRVMTRPLACVPADAFIYRAIGRMNRLKIRHLGVTNEDGHVVGALSARDLLRLRAEEAVALGDEIDMAEHASDLARAWAKLPHIVAALIAEGVPGSDTAGIISRELGALTRQAAVIAETRMRQDGEGAPPCPYAVAVLGSAGRGESLLALDQDNALVFAEGAPGGSEDRWFEALADRIASILHEVGVPYCRGGVMAKNPQWRGSLATWRQRAAEWIGRSSPQDLLSVDIFFDLRPVHGDGAMANAVWREGFELARGELGFAKLLADAAGTTEPGLNLLGGIRTRQGRIDLKKAGLFGIVTLARVLAIRHHVVERTTAARIAGVKALGVGAERDLDALIEAQGVLQDLVLDQQIDDVEHGIPATNTVVVKRLTRHDRDRLRAALGAVRHLDDLVRDLLFR
jgi:DNA polymerase-3 subunit epsilon/CBS domain-containing protein